MKLKHPTNPAHPARSFKSQERRLFYWLKEKERPYSRKGTTTMVSYHFKKMPDEHKIEKYILKHIDEIIEECHKADYMPIAFYIEDNLDKLYEPVEPGRCEEKGNYLKLETDYTYGDDDDVPSKIEINCYRQYHSNRWQNHFCSVEVEL